jgi:hypothetical protein
MFCNSSTLTGFFGALQIQWFLFRHYCPCSKVGIFVVIVLNGNFLMLVNTHMVLAAIPNFLLVSYMA